MRDLPLDELLKRCCQPNGESHQNAWREFIRRFKPCLYSTARAVCHRWDSPSLDKQFDSTVEDVVLETFKVLCRDEFRALGDYRARQSEEQFRYWLYQVCKTQAFRFLLKNFPRRRIDERFDRLTERFSDLSFEDAWDLYDAVVASLRKSSRTSRPNLERDVHIFLLYVWADFSKKMVKFHPSFAGLGERVVDLVVSRFREALRNDKDFKKTMREILE